MKLRFCQDSLVIEFFQLCQFFKSKCSIKILFFTWLLRIGSVKSYAQKSKQAAKEKSRYAMEESPRATSRCFMFMYFLLPH